ncbi:MAG: ABC transporter ATP-binding protein/permease [Clostridia bacterium]|nr:ABC transporter ATP-binding protein/permease [Clostridia bacterium]
MLTIQNLRKEYRTGTLVQKALDGVSVSFREKEFVAILGPSGSGKTTLLNMIGGLDRYDSGDLKIRGVSTQRYSDRDWDTYRNHTVGFIFQSYNLIPHQTLLANVELALTLNGVSRQERRERALDALERVGLKEQAQKKPGQLSGGQMQRVAIARALVNRPAILLADEPTGALDTDTGRQVMELLKEVAADHLVIMVTHNPKLAKKYATRIVKLKDGQITKDSNPYEEAESEGEERRLRKPSMSFATSLSLSLANLWSKKARTALVAFAASIGIVGIALILSLSNGANAYIRRMEQESLSQYPLQIMNSAFSMEDSLLAMAQLRQEAAAGAEDGRIQEAQMMGGFMASAATNDLASLKRWLDSGYSGMEAYARGITYSYGITPQIYLLKEDGYRQVNPDQTLSTLGVQMDESLSSIMANYRANELFRALPEEEDLYRQDYEILAGKWPEKDTDCVLVLSGSGRIPDVLLYTMGLRDGAQLDAMIEGVVAGSQVDTGLTRSRSYAPEEFLGISFRLLPAYERYVYDERLGLWADRKEDEQAMLSLIREKGQEMRIVGVAKPKEGGSFGMLEMGIEYPAELIQRLIREALQSPLVQAQLAAPERDVLTGSGFGKVPETDLSFLTEMIEIHPEKLGDAVSFRWQDLDSLETEETRLTARRLVAILREMNRGGESPTLKKMIDAGIPLLMNLVQIDTEKIGEAVSLQMGEARLQEYFSARAAAASATLSGNLLKFGYAAAEQPTMITFYPTDFESKEEIIRLLEAYNDAVKEEGYPEKAISYTDYVGALMSSVTTIIDVITYVLIAFVAVSLVVSSIMIGIITYISVLERRKEIGILRAMGASKRNVIQVFNAETFIIGILAGAFGIGLTLLLQIPINYIIRRLAEQDGIRAFLPAGAGGILILLCVGLTLIGGFIPARKAAKQDPVEALRSE